MANWNNPTLTSSYTDFVTEVKDRDVENAVWFEGMSPTNLPTNAKRLNTNTGRFEKWNGTSWVDAVGTFTFPAFSVAGAVTLSGGTANGVAYLNGSKVLTSGSALTFDGSNLLIGATTAGGRLSVRSTGAQMDVSTSATDVTFEAIDRAATGNSIATRWYTRNGDYIWNNGSYSEAMRLTSTGLGIGTSSPETNLHIAGTNNGWVTIQRGNDAENIAWQSWMNSNGYNQWGLGLINGSNNLQVFNYATISSAAVFDTSGNFLLGTTTNHYATTNRTVFNINGTSSSVIGMESGDATAGYLYADSSNLSLNSEGTRTLGLSVGGAGVITFATNGSERLRIDSSGNVGIGTSSPSYKLDVSGDVNVTGDFRKNGTVFYGLTGGQTGAAPLYGARAWVNFNGTGTVAIRASGNVSSITDNGTGDYTVNFTNAMPDVNFSVGGTAGNDQTLTGDSGRLLGEFGMASRTSSSCRVTTAYVWQGIDTTVLADSSVVSVQILR